MQLPKNMQNELENKFKAERIPSQEQELIYLQAFFAVEYVKGQWWEIAVSTLVVEKEKD